MRFYSLLDRLRIPFGYLGKFFLLAFLAIHLPLITALALLLRDQPADWPMLAALLAATLLGTVLALMGTHALLAPVRESATALRTYAAEEVLPALPVGHRDVAGRLMTATQETLAELDMALGAARGSREEAMATLQRRERALAEVTHELRTPLTAVLGFAELMQLQVHGPLPERYADFARDITEGGRHMLTLIEDVQRFAASRGGRQALNLRPVALEPVAERAARLLRSEAAARGIEVALQVPPGLAAQADPRALLQILLNLLGNAVKYAGRGRRVEVVAEPVGGEIALRVSDTGQGMSEAELAVALEPFGRVGPREERGTGLGLPLVRTLVEAHGGRFALESKPGQGTTARLFLPAVQG